MKQALASVTVGCSLALLTTTAPAQDQSAVAEMEQGVVEFPGIGPVDLNELPPDLRANIRLPDVVYDDPEPYRGDLPPLPGATHTEQGPVPVDQLAPGAADETPPGDGNSGLNVMREAEAETQRMQFRKFPREEIVKRMLEDRVFPYEEIPEGTYQKAWKYVQQMPEVEPPEPEPAPEPESWLLLPRTWLAGLFGRMSPSRAGAQSIQWAPIGPAPFTLVNGTKNAGAVNVIAVEPLNSQRIYIGTRNGGVFKTNDGGGTWAALTDDQPSLSIPTIAINPLDSTVVVAGTGAFDDLRSVGALRSVNRERTGIRSDRPARRRHYAGGRTGSAHARTPPSARVQPRATVASPWFELCLTQRERRCGYGPRHQRGFGTPTTRGTLWCRRAR